MAGGIKLQWRDRNFAENGHRIYRSDTTMSLSNMPAPIATVDKNITEYIDYDVIEGNTYYYRIGVVRGSDEAISDEIELLAEESPYDIFGDDSTISLYRFDGDLIDLAGGHDMTWGEGTEAYDVGVIDQGISITGYSHAVLPSSLNPFIEYSSRFSVSFWTTSGEISFNLMNKNGNTGFGVFTLRSSAGNDIGVIASSSSDDLSTIQQTGVIARPSFFSTAIPPNSHIVFSKTGNTTYEFFLNGVLDQTINLSSTTTSNYNFNIIGSLPSSRDFTAPINDTVFDQFRIFNRPLTQSDVDTLYNEVIN